MRLSHSQVQEWPDPFGGDSPGCEMKWAFNHLFHVPQAPGEAMILGEGLHAAIEADGAKKLLSNNAECLTLDTLIALAHMAIDKRLAHDDPDGRIADRRENMMARVHSMLAAYVQHVQRRYIPNVPPETEYPAKIGGVDFTGKIDAQTERAIIDWKTASALIKRGREWIDDPAHADQAISYMLLSGEETVRFIVFACSSDTPDNCVVKTYSLKRADLDLAQYENKVAAVAKGITAAKDSGRFRAHLTPLCAWCGFLGACAPGQTWINNSKYSPAVPRIGHTVSCDCGEAAPVTGYRYDGEQKAAFWQATCEDCGAVFERAVPKSTRKRGAA